MLKYRAPGFVLPPTECQKTQIYDDYPDRQPWTNAAAPYNIVIRSVIWTWVRQQSSSDEHLCSISLIRLAAA